MNWEASGNADNGLYVCNGSDWTLIQGLDSAGTPPPFQGSNYGYTSGGTDFRVLNIIDKFPFAADCTGTATDVGDFDSRTDIVCGTSSATMVIVLVAVAHSDVIDKFSFATDANATDVGDLTCRNDIIAQVKVLSVTGFGYTMLAGTHLVPPMSSKSFFRDRR